MTMVVPVSMLVDIHGSLIVLSNATTCCHWYC